MDENIGKDGEEPITLRERVERDGFKKGTNLERIRVITKERSMSGLADMNLNFSKSDDAFLGLDIPKIVEPVPHKLFGDIPEPYPHSKNFQRVIITEVDEESCDRDIEEARKKIKICMDMRNKYINDHPFQSHTSSCNENAVSPPPSPAQTPGGRKVIGSLEAELTKGARRRQEPVYDVFGDSDGASLPPAMTGVEFRFVKGVVMVRNKIPDIHGQLVPNGSPGSPGSKGSSYLNNDYDDENEWTGEQNLFPVIPFKEFIDDYYSVKNAIFAGPASSYSFKRLAILTAKFELHELLNGDREAQAQKSVPHRDFYNVRKVDTHVHHSACMNQKHLLRFIKHKLKHTPHEAVVFRDGKFLTLEEVFKSLNLSAYELSIDTLDMHANSNTFHRFDRFNLKYNPAGQSRLREIFLKTENVIGGAYLAEITKEVINDLESSKYQMVEWRISIYGRKASEWASLARWFYVNRLAHMNVRWLIQIPRLYDIYKRGGEVESFGQMLQNIFGPLVAVSLDPNSNPPLHYFLATIVGFDSVDDESKPDRDNLSNHPSNLTPPPDEWTSPHSPPFGYWMYYMYANICSLNKLRASRGLSTFQFRPHVGEAGDGVDHLVSTYLVAHQINHGILLRKNAALQYLYYLSQVGIAMSPLSNNMLFLDYNKNPFPVYFKQGLNVSLSTDDPLMLHYTKDPLVEEYSVATQVWKFSSVDQCEIARNSVLQSGWEDRFKLHFLGKDYSDIRETNVPEIRLAYRREALFTELEAAG